MKRIIFLFVPLLLICQDAYCGKDYSTSITMYVGENITLNPKSDCNASYCYNTYINQYNYDSEAFHVEKISHTNSLGFQNVNGSTTGTYYSFKLTALKAGIYTVTCVVQYYESMSGYNNRSNKAIYTITVKEVPKVVSISIPSVLHLSLGESYSFSPLIYETGASTTLNWNSSNTSVATIDGNGVLITRGIGTTTIYCTASNGVSAQCEVTVNPILATSVGLNATTLQLITGENLQLSATVSPANTTNPAVNWSTTNSNIATVDGSGLVTAVAPGQCNIIATTVDGSNLTASCSISVLGDVLYTDDAVGVPSGTLVLPILLKNISSITGIQFELLLPDGITVAENSTGKYLATMSDRAVDQSISGSKLSNGNYQFVVFSGTSSALTGSEGAIAYVTLNVAESMATGVYTIGMKEVELTKTDGTSLHHKDLSSKLTLTEAIIGDTNGDGKVTVTDAVGIVNHVLHRTPSVFITKAADVNGDGSITVSDAVKVVNIVLNK